jgi:hypothetical protein
LDVNVDEIGGAFRIDTLLNTERQSNPAVVEAGVDKLRWSNAKRTPDLVHELEKLRDLARNRFVVLRIKNELPERPRDLIRTAVIDLLSATQECRVEDSHRVGDWTSFSTERELRWSILGRGRDRRRTLEVWRSQSGEGGE